MPLIRDGDRQYFWFDTNKPRKEQGRAEAIARYADHKGIRARHVRFHSIHHWADRSNGAPYNLFVCESQKQHNNLHLQLQELGEILIKSGLVKVCLKAKKYFIDNPYLVNWLKDWQLEGEPNRHDPKYRTS